MDKSFENRIGKAFLILDTPNIVIARYANQYQVEAQGIKQI